jgi:hypothetical protein
MIALEEFSHRPVDASVTTFVDDGKRRLSAPGAAPRLGRPWGWLLVVIVLGATNCGPSARAYASQFHRLAASTIAFSSDGTRYAAWQVRKASPVVVLDTRADQREEIVPPAGCELSGLTAAEQQTPGAAGRFLLQCGKASGLLDVRTRALTLLPEPIGPLNNGWHALATHYVEGTADEHACRHSSSDRRRGLGCLALYDIVTGIVTFRSESMLGDLDRAGAPPICRRLRGELISERLTGSPGRAVYSDGLLAKPAGPGGESPLDRVEIERCSGRRSILYGRGEPKGLERGEPENLDARGGLLTWDTGRPGTFFQDEEIGDVAPGALAHGALTRYQFSTRRRRRWTLPRLPLYSGYPQPTIGVFGYSTHTTSMIFWIAAQTVEIGHGSDVAAASVYVTSLR